MNRSRLCATVKGIFPHRTPQLVHYSQLLRNKPSTSITSSFQRTNERFQNRLATGRRPAQVTEQEAIVPTPSKNLLPLSLVTSPTVKTALPFLGHGAYIIVASGFLMTDMLQLRLVLTGGYTLLVAFHAFHPRPLRIPLGWSALFILVNASAAGVLWMDQFAPEKLGDEDEALYEDHFREALTKGQFYQLMKLAERKQVPDGTLLSTEGQCCEKLYFLQSGSAKLYHHGYRTATIEQGGFVNDVAFSSGPGVGAYGTVFTDGVVSLLIWDAKILRRYLEQRPEMNRNMKFLVSEHLVKSLLRQRDGARERAARSRWWTASSLYKDQKF